MVSFAPCPSHLLKEAGHGTRVTRRDRHVEVSDVDAEFERIGCDDAGQLAGGKTVFDTPANSREVACAVGRDAVPKALSLTCSGIPHVLVQQLCFLTRFCEDDRSHIFLNGALKKPQRFLHDALADVVLFVDDLRIEEQESLLSLGSSGRIHVLDELSSKLGSELAGFVDSSGRDEEHRVRAVEVGQSPKTPQEQGHVRTQDACLLYTSDAADDLLCVDLGGRRIIKKKKKQN